MKRKYYLLCLICLLSLGACKNYLDPKPTDFLNPEAYYETEGQLQFARAMAYNNLGDPRLYGRSALDQYGWEGDGGYMGVASLTTGPFNYSYSAGDTYVANLWFTLYQGINRTNVLLANVDKNTEISQSVRDNIRGEMLCLRAFYYFTLVQYFGGVPLKVEPTVSVVDVNIPRATVKETYAQIIEDLEAAEPLVPGIAELGFGGAISKSAVRGLLARVNLHMAGEPLKDVSRYSEVIKWCKAVMEDSEAGHELNPNYPQIFMNLAGDVYDIKESIWEVEFFGNRLDQDVEAGRQGWINGMRTPGTNVENGRADAYMRITSKFYDAFEDGDNRKWWNIPHFVYPATGAKGVKTMQALPANQDVKNKKYPAKWRREYETYLPKSPSFTPQNVPLLRFTDILLMYAEADNEINNGPSAEAIEAVNRVRRRGWSTGIKTITVTNGGSGYTSAPTVSFSEGEGSGASATARISGGKVTAITLDRDLAAITFFQEGEYTAVPTVTISGGGGTGAEAIAEVHSKDEANLTPEQTASKESFLALIQDERLREFGFENLRKADLLRWGIFLQVNQDMGNRMQQESPGQFFIKNFTNVTEKDLLMPIPNSELTTNSAMVQNPGWN